MEDRRFLIVEEEDGAPWMSLANEEEVSQRILEMDPCAEECPFSVYFLGNDFRIKPVRFKNAEMGLVAIGLDDPSCFMNIDMFAGGEKVGTVSFK